MQTLILEQPDSGFVGPEVLVQLEALLSGSSSMVEVVLDFETTGKTPWIGGKKPGTKVGGKQTLKHYCKQQGCSYDNTPRARVLALSIPSASANLTLAADLDQWSTDEKHHLAALLNGHVWVGHNLLFDYQWMLTLNPDVRPARIVDTMLMVTCMRPDAMYCMQEIIVRQTLGGLHTGRKNFSELQKRAILRAAKKEMSGGSMSLNDLALWLFDEKLDKAYQLPVNWWPGYLSAQHRAYCMGDVDIPQRAARALMGLPLNTGVHDLLGAIDKHRGGAAYTVMESALHGLVRMQRKGLLWSNAAAADLVVALEQEALAAMDRLEAIAPSLKSFRDQILAPDEGLDEALKNAIGAAIRAETGQDMPTTAKGNASLNSSDLKLAFPKSKVVAALQDVLQPVAERKKIPQYAAAVGSDGRIHPLTGIATITGRTSSQEPNMQNIPRDSRFRAIFAAAPGHKIIATDFSSIELRIAAALGVRAWRVLHGILAGLRGDEKMRRVLHKQIERVSWIFRAVPELQPFLENPDQPLPARIALADPAPRPQDHPPVDTWALAAAHQLCVIMKKIRMMSGGDEARLPFRLAYTKGLDPHIITALAMEAQGGRFDLKGAQPIEYIESLPRDEQANLKKSMKGPRQAAKAVGFGLIYGMSADTLWTYGIQSYGLSWLKEESTAAKDAYFDLFPEIGLWHWLLKSAFSIKTDIFNPYNSSELRPASEGGKVYQWYTLSGRPTIASKLTSGANYQDQGSGAEIAFRALKALPEDVQGMVVNFVHDEFVLECPDDRVDEVTETLEKTMIAAADSLLLKFGIPTEVESSVGDCWIH